MNKWVDYYDILGVDRYASDEEIKKAFREKAKQYHPDIYDGDDTIFKNINEAYEILSNKENKTKYDNEYDNNKNETHEEVEIDYEEVKKQYTKEEQRVAEKLALKKIINEEIEKINILIENKNEIILNAYINKTEKVEYYETINEFIELCKEFILYLDELSKQAFDRDLLEEYNLLNDMCDNLIKELDNIPISPSDVELYINGEYINKNIDKKIDDIINKANNYMVEFKSLLSISNLKRILKINYKKVIFSKNITGKKIINEINNILKLIEFNKINKEKLDELKNLCSSIKSIIIWFPKEYEDALEIAYYYDAINTLNRFSNKYDDIETKIVRIADIIKKHPKNRRVKQLYEYAMEELLNIKNESTKLKEEYDDIKNGSNSKLYSLEKLSEKSRKVFNSSKSTHEKLDKLYSKKSMESYNLSHIDYLKEDSISFQDKLSVLETLINMEKLIKVSNEIEYFDDEIKLAWQEFMTRTRKFKELKLYLDECYDLTNASDMKKLKNKLLRYISLASITGSLTISGGIYTIMNSKSIADSGEILAYIKLIILLIGTALTTTFISKISNTYKEKIDLEKRLQKTYQV